MTLLSTAEELGNNGYWMTREQIAKLHEAFNNHPESSIAYIQDTGNGSGIGPDTVANVFSHPNAFKKPNWLTTINITDEDLW